MLVLLVGVLVLIGQPSLCEVEEQVFVATSAKVKAFKERVTQAHATGKLIGLRPELEAALPQAETPLYTSVRNGCAALLLVLTVLLGSEPYWLPSSTSASGLCVSH